MKRSDYPTVKLKLADHWRDDGQCFVDGQNSWDVQTIWDAAKDLPVFELPIIGLNTAIGTWGPDMTFLDFVSHAKLMNTADMSYPIILDPTGYIADGRHRLAKAICNGDRTIKACRLMYMPEPDTVYDEDGNTVEKDD